MARVCEIYINVIFVSLVIASVGNFAGKYVYIFMFVELLRG